MKVINRLSKIIGPLPSIAMKLPSVSLSQKLFTDMGLTHFNDGIGILMPLIVKSLRKLEAVVHKEMKEISAVEFRLPALTPSDLFKISGRLDSPDLFKVDTGKKNYILSPTCEEAVTYLLNSYKMLSYKDLPVRLYQISNKFRDEKRPRSGLLRAKEFVMKDLYCFDSNEQSCEQCYKEVVNQYHHFFNLLKIPYIYAEGSTGNIGGLMSHEFHFLTEAGQDEIMLCQNCGHNENLDVMEKNDCSKCKKCQSNNVLIKNGIEVGHTFKLGTRFTEPFKASYSNKEKKQQTLQMSSFGLGLTRILAASVEVLSKPEEIKWPTAIAPYSVCIIPPKDGSIEEKAAKDTAELIYYELNQTLEDEIIMDDKTSLTVGRRIQFDKKMGFPILIVIGKSICNDPPAVEIIDVSSDSVNLVQIPDVNQFVLDKFFDISKHQNFKEKITVKLK